MSITPHRDAAVASVAACRLRMAARAPGEPWQAIARKMDVDTTEVVMVGFGDLRDIETDAGRCGCVVNGVLASALASFILTVCGGRQDIARGLLDVALSDLKRRALQRIEVAPTEGIVATMTPSEPRGRA